MTVFPKKNWSRCWRRSKSSDIYTYAVRQYRAYVPLERILFMAKIQETVDKLVKEEMTKLIESAKERAPDLEKKLEELRKKLVPDDAPVREGLQMHSSKLRPERRVEIKTVSELLDVPINELVLHFLNNVKTKNERSVVEYRLGSVYFYGER